MTGHYVNMVLQRLLKQAAANDYQPFEQWYREHFRGADQPVYQTYADQKQREFDRLAQQQLGNPYADSAEVPHTPVQRASVDAASPTFGASFSSSPAFRRLMNLVARRNLLARRG